MTTHTELAAVLELVAESGAANMRCTQSEDLHVAEYAIEKRIKLERAAVNYLRTHGPALLAMERDGELRQKIGDLFGCGSVARSDSILLTNIRNVKDFADKLDAVERTFFMVPGEPDEDYPEDGPADECLLNRWGTNTEEYVEQFRAALSTRQAGLTDAERVLLEVLEPHTRPSSFANAKRCDISITASEADTIVAALRRLAPQAKENQS